MSCAKQQLTGTWLDSHNNSVMRKMETTNTMVAVRSVYIEGHLVDIKVFYAFMATLVYFDADDVRFWRRAMLGALACRWSPARLPPTHPHREPEAAHQIVVTMAFGRAMW